MEWWGWFGDNSSTLQLLCTYICYYSISSTSDHQALDPRGPSSNKPSVPLLCAHTMLPSLLGSYGHPCQLPSLPGTTSGKDHSGHRKISQGDRGGPIMARRTCLALNQGSGNRHGEGESLGTYPKDQGAYSEPTPQHQPPLFPGHTGNLSFSPGNCSSP